MARPLFPILSAVIAPFLLHAEEARSASAVVETNAAALYRTAGKELRPLTKEENTFLRSTLRSGTSPTPVPVQESTALLKTYSAPLELVKQATALSHCDWQHDYSKGMSIPYSHLSPLLTFTRLLALQVRLDITQGDFSSALDTVRQIVTLRQQVASEKPLFVEALVQISVNGLLIQGLSHDLSKWPKNDLPRLSELLSTPTRASLKSTLRTEAEIATHYFEQQLLPSILKLPGNDPDKFRSILAGYLADVSRIEALFKLPPAEALKQAQALEKELKDSGNPLTALALPALVAIIDRLIFDDTRFAMMQTAIKLSLQDAHAVENSRDPINGKPFTYQKSDEGFTLTSELTDPKGQPLTLTFH